MDFDNVGEHCQFEMCNQKDFLPFVCDCCGKRLCLMHRSYLTHACTGALKKDVTSIECPVCAKSVKFDKSQDVNVVWDEHYTYYCTQQPSNVKPKLCSKATCQATLGPSNSFCCPKCNKFVCLSHRIPDSHDCSGGTAHTLHNKFRPVANAKPSKPKAVERKDANSSNLKAQSSSEVISGSAVDPSNTLKGSAYRRGKIPAHAGTVAASAAVVQCPFCSSNYDDDGTLMAHIMMHHPEDSSVPSTNANQQSLSIPPQPTNYSQSGEGVSLETNTSTAPASSLFREVCPLCQARFADAIQLVGHFEIYHRATDSYDGVHRQSTTDSNANRTTQNGSNSNCNVS